MPAVRSQIIYVVTVSNIVRGCQKIVKYINVVFIDPSKKSAIFKKKSSSQKSLAKSVLNDVVLQIPLPLEPDLIRGEKDEKTFYLPVVSTPGAKTTSHGSPEPKLSIPVNPQPSPSLSGQPTPQAKPPAAPKAKETKISKPTVPQHKDITWSHLEGRLNRYPFVSQEKWKTLSPEQRAEHLKNNPFANFSPEEHAAMHMMMRNRAIMALKHQGNQLGLFNQDLGFDPEAHADEFVDYLKQTLIPHEKEGKPTKQGKPRKARYSQGIDVGEGAKPLRDQVFTQLNNWARAFLVREQNYGIHTGHSGVEYLQHLKAKYDHNIKEIVDLAEASPGEENDIASERVGNLPDHGRVYSLNELRGLAASKNENIVVEVGKTGPHFLVKDAEGNVVEDVPSLTALKERYVNANEETPNKAVSSVTHFLQLQKSHKEKKEKQDELHHELTGLNFSLAIASKPFEELMAESNDSGGKIMDSLESIKAASKGEVGKFANSLPVLGNIVADALDAVSSGDYINASKESLKAEKYIKDIFFSQPLSDQQKSEIKNLLTSLATFHFTTNIMSGRMDAQQHEDKISDLEEHIKRLSSEYADREEELKKLEGEMAELRYSDPRIPHIEDLQFENKQILERLENPATNPVGSKIQLKGGDLDQPGSIEDEGSSGAANDVSAELARQFFGGQHTENNVNFLELLFGHGDETDPETGELIPARPGLIHDAQQRITDLANSPYFETFLKNILEKYRPRAEISSLGHFHDISKLPPAERAAVEASLKELTPPMFHPHRRLWVHGAWTRLHRMDPKVIMRYAMMFSDYNPAPFSTEDVYEELGTDENGNRNMLPPEGSKFRPLFETMVSAVKSNKPHAVGGQIKPSMFERYWYTPLRIVGNAVIESLPAAEREMFERLRPLLRRAILHGMKQQPGQEEAKSRESGGSMRRRGKRIIDYLFGRYTNSVPPWVVEPDMGEQKWMERAGIKPEEQPSIPQENGEPETEKALVIWLPSAGKEEWQKIIPI